MLSKIMDIKDQTAAKLAKIERKNLEKKVIAAK